MASALCVAAHGRISETQRWTPLQTEADGPGCVFLWRKVPVIHGEDDD